MYKKLVGPVTLLLIGFTVGAVLGRRWFGAIADATLAMVAIVTIGLVFVWLLDRWQSEPAARGLAGDRNERVGLFGEHIILAERDGRLVLRVQNIGRLQFFEIAMALPRGWIEQARNTPLSPVDRSGRYAVLLFVFSLGVYAFTRLYALEEFPIYFFTDEAIHPVLASDLIRDGFRDAQGHWFPTYFQNGLYWNLSLSVYLHAVTVALFGKSILVTRATSALIGLLGAAAVGLICKWFLNIKWWWGVVLLLAITPAWFLHSRTAFETVLTVSFYAWFLLCYLLYRYRSPRYLYPALIFGAAAFYSYSNGQAVMAVSGLLLLVSDWRYHASNWRTGVRGTILLALLVLPYLRFRWQYPEALVSQLRILESYWLKPLPLSDKVQRFISNYLYGLSPQYWFIPNGQDLVRHEMKGYGNIDWWIFPFSLAGLWICLRRWRSSAHRAVLISALAAPFGSALADISITRTLVFIIPVNIMAALGWDTLVTWFKSQSTQRAAAVGATAVLTIVSTLMLGDALTNGSTWYTDYGLFGMQWGARQLFAQEIPEYIRSHPNSPVYLTPTWANGTDVFVRFFNLNGKGVELYNIDHFTTFKQDLRPQTTLIMTREELDRAQASQKFKPIVVDRTVQYPDGTDGFFFARLQYVDNIDAIFAAERDARRKLVAEKVNLDGTEVVVAHSVFDGGQVQDMFDGDTYTLARGLEANPLIVEIQFPEPRPVESLEATFAKMDFRWTILVYAANSEAPVQYVAEYTGLPTEPHVVMPFDQGPALVSKIHMEMLDLNSPEPAHVHVRELVVK